MPYIIDFLEEKSKNTKNSCRNQLENDNFVCPHLLFSSVLEPLNSFVTDIKRFFPKKLANEVN